MEFRVPPKRVQIPAFLGENTWPGAQWVHFSLGSWVETHDSEDYEANEARSAQVSLLCTSLPTRDLFPGYFVIKCHPFLQKIKEAQEDKHNY